MTHPFPTRRSSDLTFDAERQTGISLSIDAEGRLAARMGQPGGTATTVALSHPLHRHRWYHIWLSVDLQQGRSEEHTSELQSLMRISYAVFCLKKKKTY